ncbi:MAG: hypothetical protein NC122_06175 [Faecalibacterium sp.]|nr:hypothetical protein [Ruminococcus sp.]MCM1392575.1 hypothetical protein [Ruminococcus sp.]MCM1485777.1 hypothetical protein [Faecalibacterium sp.]
MDEDYTKYLAVGKELVASLCTRNFAVMLFGIYASVSNISAPLVGSAIILQILTGMFPKIRLWFLMHSGREKYIFSELNEQSYALAKSILDNTNDKPVIVFTDVYIDDEKEENAELYFKAKQLNAICLPDDISCLHISYAKNKNIILIDEDENNNVFFLSSLASEEYFPILSNNTNVYMFSENSSLSVIQQKAYTKMYNIVKADAKSKNIPATDDYIKKQMPKIYNTDCYKNIVFNTLINYPLFKAIESDYCRHDLKVSIMGAGKIGMEMFLNAYWCGQISDVLLHLNVVSAETKDVFVSKINDINPELMESCNPNSDVLRIYGDSSHNDRSPIYCNFGYCSKTLDNCAVDDIIFDNSDTLIDSDYIFVSLGSDSLNIQYAEKLSRVISINQMKSSCIRNVMIVYVVYDSNLCKMLNENGSQYNGVQLLAIGDIESIYSYDNIINYGIKAVAKIYSNEYKKLKATTHSTDDLEEEWSTSFTVTLKDTSKTVLDDELKKQYSHWSNIAKVIHMPYRVYSAFRIAEYPSAAFLRQMSSTEKIHEYFKLLSPLKKTDAEDEKQKNKSDEEKKREDGQHRKETELAEKINLELKWLEHRRWNSYLRSQGYRTACNGTEQNHILKLHHCLVECINENKNPYDSSKIHDLLDEKGDYKKYDEPKAFDIPAKDDLIKYFSENDVWKN